MPKQLYKITQFHGGLNSNSDARDIAENELSDATDVMVDELGKIRLMGGTTAHKADINAVSGWTGTIISGYGLFYFSHDRVGGEDAGNAENQTGDNYLAIYDDNDQQVWIYSEVVDDGGGTGWDDRASSSGSAPIDIGSTSGGKPVFYNVDGTLRISDANFGGANKNTWYGYIYRWVFGDGTTGYDQDSYSQGLLVDRWQDEAAEVKALNTVGFTSGAAANVTETTNGSPIYVHLIPIEVTDYAHGTATDIFTSKTYSATAIVDLHDTNKTMTFKASGSYVVDPGLSQFCSVGDKILITGALASNNDGVYTVVELVSSSVIEFAEDFDATASNDTIGIWNLSRSEWFDNDKQTWQLGISTLYDDSKQESAIKLESDVVDPDEIILSTAGMEGIKIQCSVYAGDGSSSGLSFSYPRVSGFNIYMRRTVTGETSSTENWYLQAEVDISKGIRAVGEDKYTMWDDDELTDDDESAWCVTGVLNRPSFAITYSDNSGVPDDSELLFEDYGTGFKAVTVANRIAYIGNISAMSKGAVQKFPDTILKSFVNKFDSFTLANRLDASINDGDEIVQLESYADRLLEFKKNKMILINISQAVEFIEDVYNHKGVSHPTAVCKTDFGIAWVNKQGCYLYDGQKVNNLLEKQGRQIIKESDWDTFTTNEPMIGYIPKKRQIVIVDDITTNGSGLSYLYDMVTQSWVKGAAGTFDDQNKTNFVTDWNGDLVYAHTTGTVVKWDDAAATSTAMVMSTKDIDFGNPGQKKTVYKVIVTYQSSNATTHVQLDYGVDGDTTFAYDFTVPELPAANGWQTAELVPDVPSEASNIKSFRLRFATDSTVPAGFEINDISIVYRLKGIR